MAVIDGKWLSKEGLTYFWSKIKAIFTKQTETNVIANLGAKNRLLITNKNDTFVVNGITFTKNADQTITATGSATANADYPLNSALSLVIGQKYTLSGCPTGGGVDNFFLRQLSGAIDYGDGVTFTAESSSANFFIRIRNGYTIQGSLTFKPMLRTADVTDNTFQPYAPTNRELYETKTEQTETNVIANLGAKNVLKNARTTTTHKGVTFTINEDGSVTASGTNDGTGASMININTQASLALDNGEYMLSGCPAGGSATGYFMDVTRSPGSSLKDIGNGIAFTVGGNYTVNEFRIVISRDLTVNNLTFYPMIRRAEITDTTFQPYAPTNRELYKTRFASKTILPNDVDLNDIKTGGIYNGGTSTGNSAVHMPVANGSFYFVLTVIELNESIIQIFKQLNSAGDPNLYIRRFFIYNSDWDAWYQFTGTQV